MRSHFWLWAISMPCVAIQGASFVNHLSELPPPRSFDFIIVGGGTAGNVLANRLTEDPRVSVLVVEAGGSNEGVLESVVPLYCTRVAPQTPYDWNYTTAPQVGFNGRSIAFPRGHILGGSSSINFMGYTRGSSEDYDRYAAVTKDVGWSWKPLQPYFKKNEKWTLPADHHNTTGQYNPLVHGFNGINFVSLPGFPQPIDTKVIGTTTQLPNEFPFNLDMNSGNHLGVGWTQSTIKDGERSSSATSYLSARFRTRSNLHVLLNTRVSRILSSNPSAHGSLDFRTVELSENGIFAVKQITATKEVILSSGAIGTPHILLNSGIGDSRAVSALGIQPLVDLPSVGKNLTDHPYLSNRWFVNSTNTFEAAGRNATLAADQFAQWNMSRLGTLVDSTFNNIAWLRLPDTASIFKSVLDPAAGPKTAHIEITFVNGITRPPYPPTGNYLVMGTAVVAPTSRGSVTINSTDPFSPPIIDPNFLATAFDIFTMREAVRKTRRFVTAPVWADYVIGPVSNATTDAEIDDYIRANTGTLNHPVGTAAMTPADANYGVVNPDLKVKKVKGLRIVDASVLPFIPAAHTQAAVYVFAERAADLIKSDWGIS